MISTHKIHHKLKKMGWDKHFLAKTLQILKNAEKHKHRQVKKLDKVIHGLFILIIMVGNAMIIIGTSPLLIHIKPWFSISVMYLIALCFGAFIDFTLRHLNLKKSQYLIAFILITLSSIFTFLLVLKITQSTIKQVGIFIKVNPLLFIFVYLVGLYLPHLIYKIGEKYELK